MDGRTALHEACYQGHCDIIRELLERGADMDILVGNIFLTLFFIITVIFCPVQIIVIASAARGG